MKSIYIIAFYAFTLPWSAYATTPKAPLRVTSLPTGATVYIDGINEGTTPFNEQLPPKVYRIELRLGGYVSFKDRFRLRSKGRRFYIKLSRVKPKPRQRRVVCPVENAKQCGYWRLCQQGSGKGCNNIGNAYFYGNGARKSDATARHYYALACKYKYGLGCHNLATLHRLGKGGPKSKQMARRFYRQAIALYKRGCLIKQAADCAHLGRLYTSGYGVRAAAKVARQYYKQACDLSLGTACQTMGQLYRAQKNHRVARQYFRKACQLKIAAGCVLTGRYYENQLGAVRPCWKANKYYQKACQLGDSNACLLECR